MVGVDVEYLFVYLFGLFGLVEILVVHGESVEGVGVFGVDTDGGVEIFNSQRVVVCGIDHAQFFECGRVVGMHVAYFAQKDDGVGGVASLLVDESFHEEGGEVLWVAGSDFPEVVHCAVVVAAVVGYLAEFEVGFLVVGIEFEGLLEAFVAMLYVAVGEIGVAQQHVVFELFVVDGGGASEVGDGVVYPIELKVYLGAVVVELVVFGMFLDFDVEDVQYLFVGHVLCGGAAVASDQCHQ